MGKRNESPLARPEDVAQFCQETAEFFCDTTEDPICVDLQVILARTAFVAAPYARTEALREMASLDMCASAEFAFAKITPERGRVSTALLAKYESDDGSTEYRIRPLDTLYATQDALDGLIWLRQITPESR